MFRYPRRFEYFSETIPIKHKMRDYRFQVSLEEQNLYLLLMQQGLIFLSHP